MATVPVIVRLQLPDGRVFDCHTECEEQYAGCQAFWWTEGNGGCDCNRSLYLNREYGLGLIEEHPSPLDFSQDECLACGDTIQLVSLIVNGVEIIAAGAVQ